jgi:hypothetical protein
MTLKSEREMKGETGGKRQTQKEKVERAETS